LVGLDRLSAVAIKSRSRVSAASKTGQKCKFVELVYLFLFVSLFGGTVLRITKTGSKGHSAISRVRHSAAFGGIRETITGNSPAE
jgi:hypothetical protein